MPACATFVGIFDSRVEGSVACTTVNECVVVGFNALQILFARLLAKAWQGIVLVRVLGLVP